MGVRNQPVQEQEPETQGGKMLQGMFNNLGKSFEEAEETENIKDNPLLVLKLEAEWMQMEKDYYLKKSFRFTNRMAPLFIVLCQMFAALSTEFINMALILTSNSAIDVVMDYIALGIIA